MTDEKGVFMVKGAIEKVAGIMGVSKVTITATSMKPKENAEK